VGEGGVMTVEAAQPQRFVPAGKPPNEAERLAELERLGIMDTGREPEFDQIVAAAAEVCGAPTALLTLIDETRQWYKAAVGFDEPEAKREDVICAYTLLDNDKPFILPNTLEHDNIKNNPFVLGGARFYAGWPLVSGQGAAVGTLCVVGPEPKELTPGQVKIMDALATSAIKLIEARRYRLDVEEMLEGQERALSAVVEQAAELAETSTSSDSAISILLDQFVNVMQAESAEYWLLRNQVPTISPLWAGDSQVAAIHQESLRSRVEPPEVVQRCLNCARSTETKDERGMDVFSLPIRSGGHVRGVVSVHLGKKMDLLQQRVLTAFNQIGIHLGRVMEREAESIREQRDAKVDTLTGLANRSDLERELAALFADGVANDLAVAFIDLDQFKLVNDSLGHAAGDRLLQLVAERMTAAVPDGDTLARFGGDDFVLLCRGAADSPVPVEVTRAILNSLAEPFRIEDQDIYVSASAGVALGGKHQSSPELLSAADAARYRAKTSGHKLEFSKQSLVTEARETLSLKAELSEAIQREEIEVAFQPIVTVENNDVEFFESLCRWPRPDGFVSPGVFIPLAEQTGLIQSLDRLVRQQSLAQMQQWDVEGGELAGSRVSVNVSINELLPGFAVEVEQQARKANISPGRLIIEVTESILIESNQSASAEVEELARLGFPIAVDDFGSGYSSLRRLRDLPATYLKVDASLLPQNLDDGDFLGGVVALARSLHQTLVVEGVETKQQLAALQQADIPLCQGYYFARPTDAAGVRNWMQSN
jgi:diguanylate cyclase (GGDEF)-like protein